jgi:pyridoxamine 5'-phosphate oxidase
MMDLHAMREEFLREGLAEEDLDQNPFLQFEKWFKQALESKIYSPNAFTLATVSVDGQPSVRTVLLKYFDESGFVFYTNFGSQKAKDITSNPKVALLFPWLELERQVKITGKAEKVSTAESVKYFMSRPRGSQLGAWCSEQSSVISSRSMLLSKFEEMKQKFLNNEIPLPSFWGGYRIVPNGFEFWQGRENRLHDRFKYALSQQGNWIISRLAP